MSVRTVYHCGSLQECYAVSVEQKKIMETPEQCVKSVQS